MQQPLRVTNTLTRKKEVFEPLNPPFVGMYVCGPTVYSDVHMGNVRTFISFDVIQRYLKFIGYKVRYVRNITDVGHLLDDGEDRILQKARLEQLEPMEIVHRYTKGFHDILAQMNNLTPDIEPSATGHIIDQIQMIEALLKNEYAYIVDGSVYFDVKKYSESHNYGKLSGRIVDDLIAGNRALDGQDEKRNPEDFALWKKANPEHIMRWPSPWSEGFPGWHLECSVMSTKYLGERFDIHGGGMDLKFPHHECEIAQSMGSAGVEPAKYWLHTNMLTVNGQKMSKSLGNSFLPEEMFSGNNDMLDQPYSPMTARFFMLQSHYSSTLDFSSEALRAAKKGYLKLMNGLRLIKKMNYPEGLEVNIDEQQVKQIGQLRDNCYNAMNDDFNTALTIGHLFNMVKKINSVHTGQLELSQIGQAAFEELKNTYICFIEEVLGLKEEGPQNFNPFIETIISSYKDAKGQKDYEKVDEIRATLKTQGIVLKDMKNGIDWAYDE